MQKFWIRIAAGALGVFIVGMFFVTLGRQGTRFVQNLAASDAVALPFSVGAFTVDGSRLGAFQGLQIRRKAPRGERVRVQVRLDDPARLSQLTSCHLLLDDGDIGPGATFHCADPGLSPDGLSRIGEVAFSPGNLVRPLSVAEGGDYEAAMAVNGGTVRLHRDGSQTRLIVRDRTGKAVVNLQTEVSGSRVRIRGADGREVLRLDAADSLSP